MLDLIIKWILFSVAIIFTAWLLPGISVHGFWAAMIVCVVIAFINLFIRPFVEFISLPLNFLTLGLFSLVVNALLLMLTSAITPGFEVEGFWNALFGSIILSLLTSIINKTV